MVQQLNSWVRGRGSLKQLPVYFFGSFSGVCLASFRPIHITGKEPSFQALSGQPPTHPLTVKQQLLIGGHHDIFLNSERAHTPELRASMKPLNRIMGTLDVPIFSIAGSGLQHPWLWESLALVGVLSSNCTGISERNVVSLRSGVLSVEFPLLKCRAARTQATGLDSHERGI